MRIDANDPATVDGTPQEVAHEVARDAARVVRELRLYVETVETQVRNAVMSDALEPGVHDGDPHAFWEASDEAKLLKLIDALATRTHTALALLVTTRARAVQSEDA